ncbi:hypothetical protein [Aeropyrum camini]|uniref:hypothetical protein n=1 Tax=Aeropyrum camini TaxID=229980 RepID=UPI0007879300|nr:hypothetical protein [Aeropyrum camini]
MVEDVSKGAAGYGREGRRSRILHYLMAIYILGGLPGGEYAKFIKISRLLNVSPSTVSIMTRRLQMKGLVELIPNTGVGSLNKGLSFFQTISGSQACSRSSWLERV